jgi:hypoxanthine phosphoribosyltransferase
MPSSGESLSFENIEKLTSIFSTLKWEINEHGPFKRFCEMLSILNNEQQACILRLTENFLKVDLDIYRNHLTEAISKIDSAVLGKYSHIYFMPLNVIEEEIEKQKPPEKRKSIGHSSDVIAYAFNDSDIQDHKNLFGRKINTIFSLNGLPKNFNASNKLLILVDDFIGSGETVETCLSHLSSVANLDISKVHVLVLVAQNSGIQRLQALNIKVYYSVSRTKGITDNYTSLERDQFTKIMEEIEDLLQVHERYQFGYNRTEALVKMIRTPNNTFPFYWLNDKTKHGQIYTAPFPR